MLLDEEHRRQLEEATGHSIYPGTEVLKDVEGIEFVKSDSDVLVPQPSSSPHDPLNWSPFWKYSSITSAMLLGFVQGFGVLSVAPQVPYYVKDFDATVDEVINFIGVTILVLGFSNFIWVPLANSFGRRPTAIASNVLCLGSMIWRARAQSKGSFLAACVLNGIGAGPAETLPPLIITDVCFLKHRGFYMGLYWWSYFMPQALGPVISGIMAQRYGWRSYWVLNAAMFAFLIVFEILFAPESKYERHSDVETVVVEKAESSMDEHVHVEGGGIVEKHVDTHLGKGRPNRAQMMCTKPTYSKSQFFNDVVTPFYCFAIPIMQWSSFVVSWSASCMLCLTLTQSIVFSAPPYNFSAGSVGYSNFAIIVGATLGMLVAGPFGDWISMVLTRRNGMIREPEMRLPAMWPFAVLLACGTSIVAVGYDNTWNWKVIVFAGYTFIGVQVAALPAMAISYSVDSYTAVSGEFLVSMTVNKNLWGYGVSRFLVPWIMKSDFKTPMLTNTGMCLGFTVIGSTLLFGFGKKLRGFTKNSYVHSVTRE